MFVQYRYQITSLLRKKFAISPSGDIHLAHFKTPWVSERPSPPSFIKFMTGSVYPPPFQGFFFHGGGGDKGVTKIYVYFSFHRCQGVLFPLPLW